MVGHPKIQPLWVGHSIYPNPVCGLNMKLALINGILAYITQEVSHFLPCLCQENAQVILLENHTFGPDAPANSKVLSEHSMKNCPALPSQAQISDLLTCYFLI